MCVTVPKLVVKWINHGELLQPYKPFELPRIQSEKPHKTLEFRAQDEIRLDLMDISSFLFNEN